MAGKVEMKKAKNGKFYFKSSSILSFLVLTMFLLMSVHSARASIIYLGEPNPGSIELDDTSGKILDYSIKIDGHTFDPSNSSPTTLLPNQGIIHFSINQDYVDNNSANLGSWDLFYFFDQPLQRVTAGDDYTMVEYLEPTENTNNPPHYQFRPSTTTPIPAAFFLFASGLGLVRLLRIVKYRA